MFWLKITVCLLLLLIAFYDFKYRAIPIVIYMLATLGAVVLGYMLNREVLIFTIAINLLLIALQVGILASWLKLRGISGNIFNNAFAWGDVWILIIGGIILSPLVCELFIIISSISCLVWAAFAFLLKKQTDEFNSLIPFAGVAALVLIIFKLANINQIFLLEVTQGVIPF